LAISLSYITPLILIAGASPGGLGRDGRQEVVELLQQGVPGAAAGLRADGAALRAPALGAGTGEILPLPFLRYRFCELKYRGAVGRRQVHCTLIVKIIRFYC
jgi:hypothetical protein